MLGDERLSRTALDANVSRAVLLLLGRMDDVAWIAWRMEPQSEAARSRCH